MEAIFYTHCQQSQSDAKKALLPLWASSGEGFPLLRVCDPSHGHAEVKLYTRTESFTCFLHLTSLLQVLSPHLCSSERKVHMSGQWPLARGKVLEKWLTVFEVEMPVILAIFFNLSASPQIARCLKQRKRYQCNNNQHLSTSKCSTDFR